MFFWAGAARHDGIQSPNDKSMTAGNSGFVIMKKFFLPNNT
jgi:hypothetical protein